MIVGEEVFQQNLIWAWQCPLWHLPNITFNMVFYDSYVFMWQYKFHIFNHFNVTRWCLPQFRPESCCLNKKMLFCLQWAVDSAQTLFAKWCNTCFVFFKFIYYGFKSFIPNFTFPINQHLPPSLSLCHSLLCRTSYLNLFSTF